MKTTINFTNLKQDKVIILAQIVQKTLRKKPGTKIISSKNLKVKWESATAEIDNTILIYNLSTD
jgi:hypothetical protein